MIDYELQTQGLKSMAGGYRNKFGQKITFLVKLLLSLR
jgi:hypothetical protein